ncbi:hypothetical protein GCM10023169_25560 [Georgenia halophila]|uniref:Uncharacterized protein n=1 Tax=Georgenia halophila TaxID=620889 RepID=A0ABP8LCX1_9MICO
MSRTTRVFGRCIGAVAGAAAFSLALATTASAHECYKEDWSDAAHARLSQGGTAWLPMSDLGEYVVAVEMGLPECAYVVDGVVDDYVAMTGLDAEPLVHSRATIGGGPERGGRAAPPISYLDFSILGPLLEDAVGDCLSA